MDPPGFHRMKSYTSGPIFSSLNGPWLGQGSFWLLFGSLHLQKILNQKTDNVVPSGLPKATFWPSFIVLLQKLRQLYHKKLPIAVTPLPGPNAAIKREPPHFARRLIIHSSLFGAKTVMYFAIHHGFQTNTPWFV